LKCVDVSVARRRLSANGDECSTRYHTVYGYDCQLLTISSRSSAVKCLYDAADHNPATVIAQCDVLRNDGLPGAKIFSPYPTSTRWIDVDEDSVTHNNQVRKSLVVRDGQTDGRTAMLNAEGGSITKQM